MRTRRTPYLPVTEGQKVTSDSMVTYSKKVLSPCPFCGVTPKLKKYGGRWLIDHPISDCPVSMRESQPFGYQKWAVAYWERRVYAPYTGLIKPCPFCGKSIKITGSKDYWRIEGEFSKDDWVCPIHDTRTLYTYTSKESAIGLWNIRI